MPAKLRPKRKSDNPTLVMPPTVHDPMAGAGPPISAITGRLVPTTGEKFAPILKMAGAIRDYGQGVKENLMPWTDRQAEQKWWNREQPGNKQPGLYAEPEIKWSIGEIPTWHGSAAKYKKFDPNKIGYGEGSNVFSRGAYSSDTKEIGETYAKLFGKEEGYLHKWTLHKGKEPNEYDYLNWYDDLSKDQISKLAKTLKSEGMKLETPSLKAKDIWHILVYDLKQLGKVDEIEAKKRAVDLLRKAGFDGMKYPTGTLHKKNIGGTNYVTFDPEEITIESVKRIGKIKR